MTSTQIQESLELFLNQNLDSENHFLVKVNVGLGKVKEGKVQVLMDSDLGITIEECAVYSRKLSKFLDEADLFEHAYTLEVASPGLDFPLSSERQFLKNINRKLLVELKEKGQIVEGKLIAFQKNELHLEIEEKLKGKKAQLKLVEILLENIVKAKVTVSFK
jgi:ribosome maturation factor RimP